LTEVHGDNCAVKKIKIKWGLKLVTFALHCNCC
jgi:hypothetical protein